MTPSTILGIAGKNLRGKLATAGVLLVSGLPVACGGPGGDQSAGSTGGTQLQPCTDADPFACEAQTPAWARAVAADPRSADGNGNNRANPEWGSAPAALRRTTTIAYQDGKSTPAREGVGFSARQISLLVCTTPLLADGQDQAIPNARGASDWIWQWGQFVDHDMSFTTNPAAPPEQLPIQIPKDDPYFDPTETGTKTMAFTRSGYVPGSVPRQQINIVTSFIDASMVYGSDLVRAMALRAGDGTGRLSTTQGNLLPFNTNLLINTNPNDPNQSGLFMCGDIRCNEQVGLTSIQTLFLREHNRVAGLLHAEQPELSDDQVYQLARAVIGAEIAHITFDTFLPMLLGPTAIPAYSGYKSDADPRIENLFTVLYRVGHSMLDSQLQMLGPSLASIPSGPMSLQDAFFDPEFMIVGAGLEPALRGLSTQRAQEVDTMLVSQVQDFLFGQPVAAGALDLAALNIQRGRDHGLGSYNQCRLDYGLAPAATWSDVSSDPTVQAKLAAAYQNVDQIDPWLGALAEDHLPGAMVGQLLQTVLSDQFIRTRDGDRYWYENTLPADLLAWVKTQTLAKIIRRNTSIGSELQDDVFTAPAQ